MTFVLGTSDGTSSIVPSYDVVEIHNSFKINGFLLHSSCSKILFRERSLEDGKVLRTRFFSDN